MKRHFLISYECITKSGNFKGMIQITSDNFPSYQSICQSVKIEGVEEEFLNKIIIINTIEFSEVDALSFNFANKDNFDDVDSDAVEELKGEIKEYLMTKYLHTEESVKVILENEAVSKIILKAYNENKKITAEEVIKTIFNNEN